MTTRTLSETTVPTEFKTADDPIMHSSNGYAQFGLRLAVVVAFWPVFMAVFWAKAAVGAAGHLKVCFASYPTFTCV